MINKVILVGRLGANPETRNDVTSFNIATSEQWKDQDGTKQERTEWHRIVAFKRLGEICGQYLTKGKLVCIEGKIQTRSWENKEGGKRYITEIIANTMKILDKGQEVDDTPVNDNIPF